MNGYSIKVLLVLSVALILINCDAGSFVEPGLDGGDRQAPGPATSLAMDSVPSMITEDDNVLFRVIASDADGTIVEDVQIGWSSTDESVAYIESSATTEANVVAKSPGTATITASYEELSTSATIEVHRRPVDLVYAGGSGQRGDPGTELADSLAVRIIDKRGDAVSDVQISFVVVSGGGAVSPQTGTTDADGRLSAAWTLGAAGPQVIEARASASQARVKQVKDSVVVFTAQFTDATAAAQVASVTVSPAADTVETGSTAQLHATVRDADGNELTGRAIRWSSSDTTVATVDDQGVVAGLAIGQIAALAKVDGVSGAADVMVAEPADGTLTITSPVDTLFGIGDRATLTAEARAADGSLISQPGIQWSSSDPGTAEVDTMGTVTARALGVAIITASAACCSAGDFVELTIVDDTTAVDTTTVDPPPQGDSEPSYSPDTDILIDADDLDAFDAIASENGTQAFVGTYPSGRAAYPGGPSNNDLRAAGTADQAEDDGIITLTTGRGGTGNAVRMLYGGSNGLSDGLVGPRTFKDVGGGSYQHLYFTTWFRTSPGANPAAENSSSVKGFMFWTDYPSRLELRPTKLRYGGSRWDGSHGDDGTPRWQTGGGYPENDLTGLDHWKTVDGLPPSWSGFNDGNWHRVTMEIHSGNIPESEKGWRLWLDGELVFDNVGEVPVIHDLYGYGVGKDWKGADFTGGMAHRHDIATEGWSVWGNYVNSDAASKSPQFTVDFDEWMVWTDR